MGERTRRDVIRGGTVLATAGLTATAGCLGGGTSSNLDRLTVAYVPIYPNMHHYVMDKEGFYDDIPVPVETERFSSGPSVVKAFASDEIDVALFGITPSMVLVDKGKPASVLAANSREGFKMMGTTAFADLYAEHGRDAFERFESQNGRKVRFGAPPDGSVPDVVLRYWIEQDLGLGELESVVSKSKVPPANAPQTMQAGDIDATIIQEPFATVISNDADFREVAWSGAVLDGHPVTVLFAQKRVVDDTDVAEALVSAHVDATNFIRDDPEAAARDASAVIGSGVSDDLAVRAMDSTASNFLSDPHAITSQTETMAQYVADVGNTDAVVENERLFHFSAYDTIAQ
ncbi:ABC transporter substrate-binding protein [Halorientalis marina]|uniref:ABC transporter substrate-binding protein n=1 Tax=Halorientalis marina TaxID=2931976 RepID=UPI001FF30385|nr:ABC transporter substrate-binding protein [Halorientalis marina]